MDLYQLPPNRRIQLGNSPYIPDARRWDPGGTGSISEPVHSPARAHPPEWGPNEPWALESDPQKTLNTTENG